LRDLKEIVNAKEERQWEIKRLKRDYECKGRETMED
jgi:hypothetical protein